MRDLEETIEKAWRERDALADRGAAERAALAGAVEEVFAGLEAGRIRVAEPGAGGWRVNEWVKQAILLAFRLWDARVIDGPWGGRAFDRIPLRFGDWTAADFARARIRIAPGAIIRRGAHLGPDVVCMPSFVNVGAHVGAGTMVDTWATIGSCAQIGARCHISGGAGIGGVLEPLQAAPVIIEDDVFIGARAEIAEGVIVERGAVIAMGVFLSASTRIVDRETGEVFTGRVPAGAVVVPGALPGPAGGPALAAAVIVKRVDARTRAKVALNELLRP